jgi:2-(1,2-epoxy-1,2-dihydrophenyl)acetyl-CoA isomerase
MASSPILVTSDGGVRTITLNRPERLNAIDPELADALPRVVDEASRADDVRVVVITGAGRGFCSGLDISSPPRLPDATRAERLDPLAWVGRWVMSLTACEKPVIAAVNGVAAGAGFGLALAADIRLIASSARLTAGYVRRALSPDTAVSYFLPRLVGASRATEILFTGRDLDAAEAERIGLAAAVIPDESFAEQVRAYASRLAAGPPVALALTKRLVASSFDAPLAGQLERELAYIKTCFASRDAAEALRAFSEKRTPIFSGE